MVICPFCKSELIITEYTIKARFSHDYYKCKCQLYHGCGNWIWLHDESCFYEENGYKYDRHSIKVFAVKPQR